MRKKNIYIVVSQGFSSRYLLRSQIYEILKETQHNIIILSPSFDEPYFVERFTAKNVFHEKFRFEEYKNNENKVQLFFTLARLYSFKHKYFNNFTQYWRQFYFSQRKKQQPKKIIYDLILKTAICLLSRYQWVRKFAIHAESILTKKVHRDVFNKYPPDVVITTSLGMLPFDRFIMQEARRNHAKVISLVLSWDNTTTKGIAGAEADNVIAWTETMKSELVKYHDVKPEKVYVGGVAQYDEYFKDENLYSKDYLFDKYSLDKNKKTIFYCLESPTAYKWNAEIIEILGRNIAQGKMDQPVQLFIRPHPIYYRIKGGEYVYQDDIVDLKRLEKKYPFMVFDHPEVLSEKLSYDMPGSEVSKLGALLKFSDVVLCFYSSINIEASIFNTPVINVGLYSKVNLPNEVVKRHAHNKRILETGGVASVSDENSLIEAINTYLNDRKLHAIGRKTIVDSETGPNKGCAADHIGRYLTTIL